MGFSYLFAPEQIKLNVMAEHVDCFLPRTFNFHLPKPITQPQSRLNRDTHLQTVPSGAIPPVLPPSVEESYRRKCIQLKTRMNEVEEANDVSRLRLVRMQRQIEKMRLERAFLLEQLSKRCSTNVDDSEGSPSPPPTVCIASTLVSKSRNIILMRSLPLAQRKAIANQAWSSQAFLPHQSRRRPRR